MVYKKSGEGRSELLSKVKGVTDKMIQARLDSGKSFILAIHIAHELEVDYSEFNNLFLSEYGMTIERLYIIRLVEKVKELLVYSEQSLNQIAKALGYKSVTSLSKLLKANTGFTSSHFKQIRKDKQMIMERRQQKQK